MSREMDDQLEEGGRGGVEVGIVVGSGEEILEIIEPLVASEEEGDSLPGSEIKNGDCVTPDQNGGGNGVPVILIEDDGPVEGDVLSVDNGVDPVNQNRGIKRKRNCDPFVQDVSCWKASKFLPRCRDCAHRSATDEVTMQECRFQHFRKLVRKSSGNDGDKKRFYVEFDGYCDPETDPNKDDRQLYIPNPLNPPEDLPVDVCKQLLEHLGDQVCALIRHEEEALVIEQSFPKTKLPIAWKRMVEDIREVCDVCVTTLFNYHWICPQCGFVACIDCFKTRREKETTEQQDENLPPLQQPNNREEIRKDKYNWLFCTHVVARSMGNRTHKMEDLQLTQIIPGNGLKEFGKLLHKVRAEHNIPQLCCSEYNLDDGTSSSSCSSSNGLIPATNDASSQMDTTTTDTVSDGTDIEKENVTITPTTTSDANKMDESEDDDDDEALNFSFTPRIETAVIFDDGQTSTRSDEATATSQNATLSSTEEDSNKSQEENNGKNETDNPDQYRSRWNSYYKKKSVARKVFSYTETIKQYPGLEHSWLVSGTLLRLENPDHERNGEIFQEVWKRGQPVLVSNVGNKLSSDLWSPESFLKEYGEQVNDLVNCLTGYTLRKQKIKKFWQGFSDVKQRMLDESGEPMLLKLKDWPATEDFAKFSAERFDDLMKALPLKEYTHRTGRLNLAARLPSNFFIRPDLGPKMYIAYGDGKNLEKGTTVLHLDMSDAVNCMVYVGRPKNADPEYDNAIRKAIKESDCDAKMIQRVTKDNELPGALWHIYRPWDAEKIRDLLNKVCIEEGNIPAPKHDPIHDQVMYLDEDLRKRLREEYNVDGFAILQCAGDAVFIPAGAPHQVRNLHNCIKIAEDFVSPENVSHCFQLTEEFRNLSDTHINHEDKLQIKNIVYHAVKDAMSVLINKSTLLNNK